jgi:hypothetical protein
MVLLDAVVRGVAPPNAARVPYHATHEEASEMSGFPK